jgi:hypothetical protein
MDLLNFPRDIMNIIWNNCDVISQICLRMTCSVIYKRYNMRKLISKFTTIAARKGYINILDWANKCGMTIDSPIIEIEAARTGNIDLMNWIQMNWIHNSDLSTNDNKQNLYTFAACAGHTNICDWLYKHNIEPMEDLYHTAAAAGKTNIMQWLHYHNYCIKSNDEFIWGDAVRGNHMESVQWIYSQNCCPQMPDNITEQAAIFGNLEFLKWYETIANIVWDGHISNAASIGGYIDILEWCYGKDQFNTIQISSIIHNKLEVVKWSIDKGIQYTEIHLNMCDDLAIIKYIMNAFPNIPISDHISTAIVSLGTVEDLEWLNNRKLITQNHIAGCYASVQKLEWVHNHKIAIDDNLIDNIWKTGDLESLEYLVKYGLYTLSTDDYKYPFEDGNCELLMWIFNKGIPLPLTVVEYDIHSFAILRKLIEISNIDVSCKAFEIMDHGYHTVFVRTENLDLETTETVLKHDEESEILRILKLSAAKGNFNVNNVPLLASVNGYTKIIRWLIENKLYNKLAGIGGIIVSNRTDLLWILDDMDKPKMYKTLVILGCFLFQMIRKFLNTSRTNRRIISGGIAIGFLIFTYWIVKLMYRTMF